MKTNVSNYIYNSFNERGMKSFEKKVSKLLKGNGIFGEIICHNAYMERGNGRGSYCKCAEIEVNGDINTLRTHTNDSKAWDNWENPSTKDKRDLFFAVLEDQVNELKELLNLEL